MHHEMHASTKTKIAMQVLPHAQGCTCHGSCGVACACKINGSPGCCGDSRNFARMNPEFNEIKQKKTLGGPVTDLLFGETAA
jgi:hypothetical protein